MWLPDGSPLSNKATREKQILPFCRVLELAGVLPNKGVSCPLAEVFWDGVNSPMCKWTGPQSIGGAPDWKTRSPPDWTALYDDSQSLIGGPNSLESTRNLTLQSSLYSLDLFKCVLSTWQCLLCSWVAGKLQALSPESN